MAHRTPPPTPEADRLKVRPFFPELLYPRIEALVEAGDLAAAAREAARGAAHFPGHGLFQRLAQALGKGDAAGARALAGWTRPWHLTRIPRKAHFYWGNERTSYLRYLSVASFKHHNPDWEVNLYVPTQVHQGGIAWEAGESYEGTAYHGRDYSALLYQMPGIRVREVDFSAFPEIARAPETYKSDFFRWHILNEEGGIYADTDILFFRSLRCAGSNTPAHKDVEAGICLHQDTHIIGFYMSAPGTSFFQRVQQEARAALDERDYQSIGSHLLNRLYPTVSSVKKAHPEVKTHNLPLELVYPFDWKEIDKIHAPGDPAKLPAGCVGIHWFAGSPLTQRFNNLIDHTTCGTVGTLLDRMAAELAPQLETATRAPAAAPAEVRFSVLVPTYNQAHFLPAALDSLLAQTYGNWEAIVVNDGSTDGTREVLEAYAARDPRIKPHHQTNGGVGAALNAARAKAEGDWICWLSSDDLFEPDALEAFAKGIAEFPKARFFYSNFSQLFEETGEKRPIPSGRQADLPPFGLQTIKLLEANYINGITVCVERGLFEEVGPWKPELRYAQDLDLWLRMSGKTRLHYLDHRTAVTRVHRGQGTQEFPMAGFFDSARAALDYLNAHPLEELFPWMDLRSQGEIIQAVEALIAVSRNLHAFLYHGVGPHPALVERLGEWIDRRCPEELRQVLIDALVRAVDRDASFPAFLAAAFRAVATPEGRRYQPRDPLALMEDVLRRLEAGGEAKVSAELRRYLERVVGRRLDGDRAPSPTPDPTLQPKVVVSLVKPEGYLHSEGLREVAETLLHGFRALGCAAELQVNGWDPQALNVVVGWHLLEDARALALEGRGVLYNLEQMDALNEGLRNRLITLSAHFEVWDYSRRNLDLLKAHGLKGTSRHLPIGMVPELTRIAPAATQDLDVLFYGSVNPRRAAILEALQAAGLKVHHAFGVYGAERDALIARAKVVLNLHFYEASIFEVVRVSYLLANRKAVVAECHGATEVDPDLREAVRLAPYDALVQACVELCRDDRARAELEARGHTAMVARREVDYLREVLAPAAPAVSVILPTKDRPAFLARALDSLATQTFTDFEVQVVNDGGEDITPVLEPFRARGLRITAHRHPVSRGQAASRNTGIAAARGTWIAYLDDDDLYHPDHLQVLVETLTRTGAQVAYTDSERVVEEEVSGRWEERSRELAMSHPFDREHFLRDNLTPVNNVMHARACWEAVGPHDETLPVLEDWDYWIRLSRRWDFLHIPQVTAEVRWRQSGANITFQRSHLFPECRARIAAKVQALLAEEARHAEALPVAFLCEPDWASGAWMRPLDTYLRAFRPGEPVLLAFLLDPARIDPAEAQTQVLTHIAAQGIEAFPDLVLVEDPGELPEVLAPYGRLLWTSGPKPGAAGDRWRRAEAGA
jgi:glycosyltransferase involved in cell wall biosynthesis